MTRTTTARPRDTSQSLPIALLRARDVVMSRFRPLLAEHGFTEQQWRVLRVLDESGPMEALDLAERCVILPPSLTRILKTLESADWISRKSQARDKRRFEISITAKARDAIRKATPDSNAVYADIEKVYGAARMRELLGLLDDLAKVKVR